MWVLTLFLLHLYHSATPAYGNQDHPSLTEKCQYYSRAELLDKKSVYNIFISDNFSSVTTKEVSRRPLSINTFRLGPTDWPLTSKTELLAEKLHSKNQGCSKDGLHSNLQRGKRQASLSEAYAFVT